MQNKVILIVGWGLQYEFCKKYWIKLMKLTLN